MASGKSSASEAYDLLLDAIDHGSLPPGSRLREVELAERFGISRTPVREALKRLEAQGLVTHVPHHGAVVTSLDYGQITELYHLREVLEGMAARLAAMHAAPPEIAVLREMVERDRGLVDEPAALARSNKLFHHQIHLSAQNRFLQGVLDTLRVHLVLLTGSTLRAPHRGAKSLDEHAAIVDAMARRDPDAAEAAMRTHISNAFKTRIELHLGESGADPAGR